MNRDLQLLLVLGSSGTGKSTRVYALFDFLRTTRNDNPELLYHEQSKVAVKLPLNKVVIMGYPINFRGVDRWQGADGVVNSVGGVVPFFALVRSYIDQGFQVIVEGYSIFNTTKSMPIYLHGLGVTNATWIILNYETLEQYQARIAGRSGREGRNKGNNNFGKNREYHQMPARIQREIDELLANSGVNTFKMAEHPHTAPVDLLGHYFLNSKDEAVDFLNWCAKQDYISRFTLPLVADNGRLF